MATHRFDPVIHLLFKETFKSDAWQIILSIRILGDYVKIYNLLAYFQYGRKTKHEWNAYNQQTPPLLWDK